MSITLLLIIGASGVFFLSLFIIFLFIVGRYNKQQHQGLEDLLDEVSAKEDERKAWLVKLLMERFAQQEQPAIELCEDFIAAEKQFLHAYMEQQLSRQPGGDFYEHICQLLDTYLKLLTNTAQEEPEREIQQAAETDSETTSFADQADEQQQIETAENLKSATPADIALSDVVDDEVEASEQSSDNPQASEKMKNEPVNQDQHSSSEQDDDQETGDNVAADLDVGVVDTAKGETENELHPDWDEAFAEAGVKKQDSAEKDE